MRLMQINTAGKKGMFCDPEGSG
jgi:hypothetical protein